MISLLIFSISIHNEKTKIKSKLYSRNRAIKKLFHRIRNMKNIWLLPLFEKNLKAFKAEIDEFYFYFPESRAFNLLESLHLQKRYWTTYENSFNKYYHKSLNPLIN